MARLNEPAVAKDAARPLVSSSARWTPVLLACAASLLMGAPALGQQYIYISSPTPGGPATQQTLSGFCLDPAKGTLTRATGFPGCTGSSLSPFSAGLQPGQRPVHH